MAKARPHHWHIACRYVRTESDGTETELIPPFEMKFAGELLHSRKKYEGTDPRVVGESVVVRGGAVGILDSLLVRMRDAMKSTKRKK